VGLKLNHTHQLLVYADGVSKESCLEENAEENKHMLLSRHQNAGQNHEVKIGNRCFGNVAQLRYLGTTVTNQNLIQEVIKMRLNSSNDCYHSVKNLLFSRLLSKNVKIRIYKIIIFVHV
jgi:ribosomal protein S2